MPLEDTIYPSRRAAGMTKLRSRLDQAMDEMIQLHERNDIGADMLSQLRGLWHRVHELELKARDKKP